MKVTGVRLVFGSSPRWGWRRDGLDRVFDCGCVSVRFLPWMPVDCLLREFEHDMELVEASRPRQADPTLELRLEINRLREQLDEEQIRRQDTADELKMVENRLVEANRRCEGLRTQVDNLEEKLADRELEIEELEDVVESKEAELDSEREYHRDLRVYLRLE